MDLAYLEAHLRGRPLGWPILYRPKVTSTQDVADEAARVHMPEGLLVLAEEQVAGRGRRGRRWWAAPGTAILCSLLLRPRLPPERVSHIGMIAGLAITDAIRDVAGIKADLKWPNDILLGEKKVGGILVEARWHGQALEAVILGLGLNVTTRFPKHSGLYGEATSLLEAGVDVGREPLLVAYIERFTEYYQRLHAGWSPVEAWAERLITLGRPVTVVEETRTWEGIAERVTPQGELVVRCGEERRVVRAADVQVRHRAPG